jgi:hypothetical protein
MLTIEPKRALAPVEVGVEEPCAVCGTRFVTEVVAAHILNLDPGEGLGAVCHTEPVYASVEEIMDLERADDSSVDEAYRASWLSRSPA